MKTSNDKMNGWTFPAVCGDDDENGKHRGFLHGVHGRLKMCSLITGEIALITMRGQVTECRIFSRTGRLLGPRFRRKIM